jgi:flagellar assembly factor FliW
LKVYSTRRFGNLEVHEEEIVHFPEGLLGFADCKRFLLLEDSEIEPFLWLQSLDNGELAFVVVDPKVFFPDYRIEVPRGDLATIEIENESDARILVLVVLSEDVARITANLKGPLVLNPKNRHTKQVVVMDDRYGTQHLLRPQIQGIAGSQETQC